VLSTDPAHSLGDVIGKRLAPRVTTVTLPGRRRALEAAELDGPRIFARWLRENRRALGDILEHGSWLDRPDVEGFLDLSLPGLDELVAMLEVLRCADRPGRRYDHVVVDTAPTGHTLRLFSSPGAVAGVASLLDGLEQEQRLIRSHFGRLLHPEATDRLIASLAEHAERTAALLREPARTSVRWVTLPEEMAVAETERAIGDLRRIGISVSELIVNRVTPDGPSCPLCDGRRARERRVLAAAGRTIGSATALRAVPAASSEPRGMKALMAISATLSGNAPAAARSGGEGSRRKRGLWAAPGGSSRHARADPPAVVEVVEGLKGARLVFVVGKGGVGKTTVSAALALRLARSAPSRRMLLLSTDPAHSIGDLFGIKVGDRDTNLPGASPNLRARELDAVAALAASRADLEAAVADLASAAGGLVRGGRAIVDLLELAPPGIDELLGLVTLVEAGVAPGIGEQAEGGPATAEVIVVDTAPTGHALRLLEMPAAAREWLHALMKLLLKYRELARPGKLGAELLRVSQAVGALQDLLRDPRRTKVVVVTRAGEVVRRETTRLIARLTQLKFRVGLVVVNALTPPQPACAVCRSARAHEKRELDVLRRVCRARRPACAIITTAITEPPPTGAPTLEAWAATWTRTS
jgi:arsenite-transporting ATPase